MDSLNSFGVLVEHDIASTGSIKIGMHEHAFYELYFLVSGNRRYMMKHSVYDVEPGNLVFIPKKKLHRAISAKKTGYDRYVLYFSDQQAARLAELLGGDVFSELVNQGCIQLPGYIAKQVQKDMEQILQETTSPSLAAYAIVTHLLQGIMLNALRYGSKKQCLVGESADKVQMIAKFITEHYREEITLSKVAEMACLEKTYFSKLFKTLTGFGFQEYLLQTRLLAAEQMLMETKLSMSEIAENCGFSCSNYFGDVFRRYKGLSPSAYRKQIENVI